MGHVSIGVEVQRNTDGDTPSSFTAAAHFRFQSESFKNKFDCILYFFTISK